MDDSPSTRHSDGAPDRAGLLLGGRYRLVRPIATGGMAQVWEANDEVLVRPVALKLLHGHLALDEAFITRFRHEAIAAARLSHPSIVSIYDTVSDDGIEAIVMELVHGTTLRRRLDVVHTMETREVVAIGSQVADALDAAHHAHVVHRDIKPANILLSTDGRVLVADFGIAKALEGADLTAEGAMVGTAKYLAPEQVEGTKVDGRTDQYALGVVLYEALCGRVPFQADTDTGTALARLHQAPMRPRQIRSEVPHDIEDVVMRAMARHPGDRFDDAAQLRAALLDCVNGPRPVLRVTTDDTAVVDNTLVESSHHRDRTPSPEAAAAARIEAKSTPSFSQSERGWLLPALLIVLVALALGVAGVLFGTSPSGQKLLKETPPSTAPKVTAVPLALATPFDPSGDGVEDNEGAGRAIDGNLKTFWHTETYEVGADIQRMKPGVGLVVTLDKSQTVSKLIVHSPSAGWDASVYVVDHAPGTTLESWGKPVASHNDIRPGATTFDLGHVEAHSVLLWITKLQTDGQVRIAEMTVKG